MLLPAAVVAVRVLLNEGLNDLEAATRALLGRAARQFLENHPEVTS